MNVIPSFNEQVLRAICDVLGNTSEGLTGSEIGQLLAQCNIHDPSPETTKRYRLYAALNQKQKEDRCANNIIAFIQVSLDPVRFVRKESQFQFFQDQLNQVIAFAGYKIKEDGKFITVSKARTLSESEQRAGRLRLALERRIVHPDVLRFCKAELLQDNYFHAVLEATKSIGEKIRNKTGLNSDGSKLIDEAFGLNNGPLLVFNTLQTESERSEHKGMMNLMKGVFGLFRNPTAHEPRVTWNVNEADAMDLLTMVSLIHRRLDEAVPTNITPPDKNSTIV